MKNSATNRKILCFYILAEREGEQTT